MKVYLKQMTHFGGIDGTSYDIIYLTIGKIYDAEELVTIYDPDTLKESNPYYIVRCNDNKYRKVDASFFINVREFNLEQLGI